MRLSLLMGLPVLHNGRLLGRVERAVSQPDGHSLRGLVLRRGLGGARWIEADQIDVLGRVAVILSQSPLRLPQGTDFSLQGVRDTGGMALGWVTDAFMNPVSHRFTALEISLGLVEEWQRGRFIARHWTVNPATGQVMIPCGCALEAARR